MAASNRPPDRAWRPPANTNETVSLIEDDRSVADYRLENARLRMQLALLERELETEARKRQSLIDHYEGLLADLESELEGDRSDPSGNANGRLRDLLPFDNW